MEPKGYINFEETRSSAWIWILCFAYFGKNERDFNEL